jgi:hypothetical protein
MKSYEFEVSNCTGDDDSLINDAREAIARTGCQVGDCDIVERNHTDAVVHVEVEDPAKLDTVWWNGVVLKINGEVATKDGENLIEKQKTKWLPSTIECKGDGIWDDTTDLKVTVTKMEFCGPSMNVYSDCKKLIYTDTGFERGMNALLKHMGLNTEVYWSEQGLQNPDEGVHNFDTTGDPMVVFEPE